MSGCISFLLMLFMFLIVTSGIPLPFSRRDSGRSWRRLAREFNGVFTGLGILSPAVLRFRYGTSRVTFTANRKEAKVVLSWPDTRLTCDVVSRSRRKPASTLPTITLDEEEFDKTFRLHGDDQGQARTLLSPGFCMTLDKLAKQRNDLPVHINFRPGQLTVRKFAKCTTYDQLYLFLRAVLELYDQAMLTRAEGIDFCEEDDFRPVEDVRCQVCGEEIYEDLVCCARCHTPHHQECWDYYGSCTVYGCQETEYQHPKTAALLSHTPDGALTSREADTDRPSLPVEGAEAIEASTEEVEEVEEAEVEEAEVEEAEVEEAEVKMRENGEGEPMELELAQEEDEAAGDRDRNMIRPEAPLNHESLDENNARQNSEETE